MKRLTIFLAAFFLIGLTLKAQFRIVSSSPADGSVNVSLTDTIKVTFSSAIDTSYRFSDMNRLVTNIYPEPNISFSSDLKTVFIKGMLMPNMDYFLLFYYVHALDGSILNVPVKIEFTTASAFQGVTISGKVSSIDSSVVDNSYALVGLSLTDLTEQRPTIAYLTVADSNGFYSFHHVKNDKYFPFAVQDVNKDGEIDTDSMDVITLADSIIVNGNNISGLNFLFQWHKFTRSSGLELISSDPADYDTGVTSGATTLSFTFNMPLDTSKNFKDGWFISNIKNVSKIYYSSDFSKVYFDVQLEDTTDYFVLFYSLNAVGGAMLDNPVAIHFTTRNSYGGVSVSGKVTSSIPQLSPAFSIVGLADSPPNQSGNILYLEVADTNGEFELKNVAPGTYFPFAVKDVNMDGLIEVENGIDPGVIGQPITITNSDFSNLVLNFTTNPPTVKSLNVVKSEPTNYAVNVGLNDTVKITFSEPIDTTFFMLNKDNFLITNISDSPQISFNSTLTEMRILSPLLANKDYFVMLFHLKGLYGSMLNTPFLLEFTTDSAFAKNKVSGKLISDDNSKPVAFQIVVLSETPLGNNKPAVDYFTFTDSVGNFVFDHVRNGTYYPIGAVDGNNDGSIDPENGQDALGSADSIVVNNNNVSGVEIHLSQLFFISFAKALHMADSMKTNLPKDAQLVIVDGQFPDTSGLVMNWNFLYLSKAQKKSFGIWISWFAQDIQEDSNSYTWLSSLKPLADSVFKAADPKNFIKNSFMNEFKHPMSFSSMDSIKMAAHVQLGDLHNSEFWDVAPDSNFYWGVSFTYFKGDNPWDPNNIVRADKYLADYKTGTLIKQTGVKQEKGITPQEFALFQNYPNPFNPTTTIKFRIAKAGFYTLNVYNILGQKVASLLNNKLNPGSYRVTFNATNLPSGVYIYRLEGTNVTLTKKMLLLK